MNLSYLLTDPIFRHIGRIADEMGREVYVVGGYVRDLLLHRPSKDIDFVTVGSGIELARAVADSYGRKAHLSVFATYGTAQVKLPGVELEFVGARRESYHRESRNPIVEEGSLDDDISRRDFSINAMAICLNEGRFGQLVDKFDGLADLDRQNIRTPLNPDITFSDDPLRMMRAIRFATQLGFFIDPVTFKAIQTNKHRIEIITKERINDELSKIIRSPKPSIGFRLLDMSGLLPIIFPEVAALKGIETRDGRGHKDNFIHTLQVLDNVAAKSDDEWLRWAALLHDIAKPQCKRYDPRLGWTFHNHNFIGEKMIPRIFRRMKLPLNEKMKFVAKMVGMHMRPQGVADEGVTDSGVRRLMTDAGPDLEALMTLCEADITSKIPEKVKRQLEGFATLRQRIASVADADHWRNYRLPINGNELREVLGIPDGKIMGMLLGEVKEEILNCRMDDDHDVALNYVAARWAEINKDKNHS